MRRCFTLDERLCIEALLKQGRTNSYIATSLKRPIKSIGNEIRRRRGTNGYSGEEAHRNFLTNTKRRYNSSTKVFSEGEIEYAKHRYNDGINIRTISIEMGTSERVLNRIFRDAGIVLEHDSNKIGMVERVQALEEQLQIILDIIKEMGRNGKD